MYGYPHIGAHTLVHIHVDAHPFTCRYNTKGRCYTYSPATPGPAAIFPTKPHAWSLGASIVRTSTSGSKKKKTATNPKQITELPLQQGPITNTGSVKNNLQIKGRANRSSCPSYQHPLHLGLLLDLGFSNEDLSRFAQEEGSPISLICGGKLGSSLVFMYLWIDTTYSLMTFLVMSVQKNVCSGLVKHVVIQRKLYSKLMLLYTI